MKHLMTVLTAALFLLATALPAIAGDKSVDLSGNWDVRSEIAGGGGATMVLAGSHKLKRTSQDNYTKEGAYEMSISQGENLLKLGKIIFTSTVKTSPTEECETMVTMGYEAPKTTPTKTLEAMGIPVDQYEMMVDSMSKTATPEDFNKTPSCDTVSSYSKNKVVLDIGDGNAVTYTRSK